MSFLSAINIFQRENTAKSLKRGHGHHIPASFFTDARVNVFGQRKRGFCRKGVFFQTLVVVLKLKYYKFQILPEAQKKSPYILFNFSRKKIIG